MYIKRTIEEQIVKYAKHFPIIMLCGPRQVGKTTIYNHLREQMNTEINYVTLDYPLLRDIARTDPELFLQQYQPPLIIDEIQYAPELLPYIKIRVDKSNTNGMYYLTGSQMFHMMKNVSESLAGRVGILSLYPFSNSEISGFDELPFLPTKDRLKMLPLSTTVSDVFEKIYRGSMPKMITDIELTPEEFYSSYMQTYLERDIRDLISIKDESKFLKFIACVAARTGQELVYNDLAKDTEVDAKTANSWLSILVSSGIIYLLQPYYKNTIKRIIKRPKLYFMDTGLACYLSLWNNPRSLELSAMAGAMFETYVVSEIIKSYSNNGKEPRNRLYFYRDNNNREIDLLIIENNHVYPVEIKKSANPGIAAIKHFSVLNSIGLEIGDGGVICMSPLVIPIDDKNRFIPISCI